MENDEAKPQDTEPKKKAVKLDSRLKCPNCDGVLVIDASHQELMDLVQELRQVALDMSERQAQARANSVTRGTVLDRVRARRQGGEN